MTSTMRWPQSSCSNSKSFTTNCRESATETGQSHGYTPTQTIPRNDNTNGKRKGDAIHTTQSPEHNSHEHHRTQHTQTTEHNTHTRKNTTHTHTTEHNTHGTPQNTHPHTNTPQEQHTPHTTNMINDDVCSEKKTTQRRITARRVVL